MIRHAVHAMGTRFEFVVAHADEQFARAAAESAAEEVLRLHVLWSPFATSSVIAAINRDAAARPVRVDHDTFAILTHCKEIHARSHGAFDVTIGHLMRHHGWRGAAGDVALAGVEQESRVSAEQRWGSQHLHLDPRTQTVSFTAPLALDLGAVAKGWALDAAGSVLREAGIAHALLHAGTSSVLAIGGQPGGAEVGGWRIQLTPAPNAPVIALQDNALSVSSPHPDSLIRTDAPRGDIPAELSHTIDPRTGTPTARLLHAATIATHAASADAWSTALLVLGQLPHGAEGVEAMVQTRDGLWQGVRTVERDAG